MAGSSDALMRQNVLTQRLASGQVRKFEPFLREIDRELRARLAVEDLTTFERARLERLIEGVDAMLKGVLGRYEQLLLDDLMEYAAHETAVATRALGAGATASPKAITTALIANADFETVIPATTQVRAAVLSNPLSVKGPDGGQLLDGFIRNWTATERRAVTGAIRLGVFEGKTNAQIIQTLRGTRARNYQDGLLQTTARRAEAVVRTAVQHVSTVARKEAFKANEDIVKREKWLSTLDKRTCPRCGALDGKEFALGKGPRPPLHPNCRCTMVPVLDDEFEGLDAGMKRAAKGAKGPGQVDAGISYYEWLKRQPAAFQDAAIGPSRARLLRDGGLSAQRFAALQMDKKFLPLTLEEMRALEPLAFQKAGL